LGLAFGFAPINPAPETKSEIRGHKNFENNRAKFNSRDYSCFLAYFAEIFEMIHVGGNLRSSQDVMKFCNFLHHHIMEMVIVDRIFMDSAIIAMEAIVQIRGIRELTPYTVTASDHRRLKLLEVGHTAIIPQFIHYHILNGKIAKAGCKE
jgi:hypothetical protein